MAVTVLTCQQAPDQQTSLYGFTIPTSYLPFAQLCMSYLFTQQIPWNDILGARFALNKYALLREQCISHMPLMNIHYVLIIPLLYV